MSDPISKYFDGPLWDAFDWRHAFFTLFMITLAMFGDLLFSGDGSILSAKGLDLYAGELSGLDFLYRELRNGNVPLWNPHVFSGSFLIATTLYPPHFFHLFLPLPQAVNTTIAFHVLLVGFFMYVWASYRKLHPLASLLAAILVMFSGPYFMHVFAGHVGNLCAMTWAPLILLAIDGILDRPSLKWALLGIFATAMQMLVGQFQYVYYTAIVVVLYVGSRLLSVENRYSAILLLLTIPVGSLLLTAFHVLPVLSASQEGVRSAGVGHDFAAMFSFPPENFITLLSPFFFGDIQEFPYWGRWYLWEMCLFTGTFGFFLAIYGALKGTVPDLRTKRSEVVESGLSREGRARYGLLAIIMILTILALGAHTPLFTILFNWLPGFNKFRGASKFIFFASLFWILLAGHGFDQLIREGASVRRFYVVPLAFAVILGGMAVWLFSASQGPVISPHWSGIIQFIAKTGESYFPPNLSQTHAFLTEAGESSALGLYVAAGASLIAAGLFYWLRSSGRVVYALILLAVIEVFVFARINRPTFSYTDLPISQFKSFYQSHPGDYRVLSFVNVNTAMSSGAQDIWGYGPVAMGRYVEFMAWTQGAEPDKATTYLKIQQYHPLFKMLRLRYLITPGDKGISIEEYRDWMPRISLLQNWHVAGSRKEVFREMERQGFDPVKTVVLEKAPAFALGMGQPPELGQSGYERSKAKNICAVVDSVSDRLTVKADLATPSILLITDNYSRGWRVRPLKESRQSYYEVMPANYTLMAIPLNPGKHLFRLEYRPLAFVIGAWMSALAWFAYGLLVGFALFRRPKGRDFKQKAIGPL